MPGATLHTNAMRLLWQAASFLTRVLGLVFFPVIKVRKTHPTFYLLPSTFYLVFTFHFPLSTAFAEPITIETAPEDTSQLESRNVVLPDGTKIELLVIRSSMVKITINDNQIILAKEIELDQTNKILRIIGHGSIQTEDGITEGENLVYDLSDDTFRGREVLITTGQIDVIGMDATRIPGQISIATGRFSPCGRCDQQTEDFGFRATKMLLYPGDRLVAYEVTMVIRDFPMMFFPILIVPLGPVDRQPKLTIKRATESTQGEVIIDWPYVMGTTAYGMVNLHYYADVELNQSNFFANAFLGGKVTESYLGTGVSHIFITDTGLGRFDFNYRPGFLDKTETTKGDSEYKVKFLYDSDDGFEDFKTHLLFERDDSQNDRILKYEVEFRHAFAAWEGAFTSNGFIDLKPEEGDSRTFFYTPNRTLAKFEVKPKAESIQLGGITISQLLFELGFFGDYPRFSQDNKSIYGARLVEGHTITLDPLSPWAGLEITGNSTFRGQYYSIENSSGVLHRLVNWDTTLGVKQTILDKASLSLSFVRNIHEGSSPFSFDFAPLNRAIYLQGNLSLTPWPWLSFTSNTRYNFQNERRGSQTGFDPIISELNLFGNLNWISLNFRNDYRPARGNVRSDPGNLTGTFTLRSPEPQLDAEMQFSYTKDLLVFNPRGKARDESEFSYSFRYGIPPYLTFDFSGGSWAEPPANESGPIKPFILGATVGTTDQQDYIPSFRIGYGYDYNRDEIDSLGFEVTAAAQPIEVSLSETFGIAVDDEETTYRLDSSNYRVAWKGVASFEASGFPLITPFPLDPEVQQNWRFVLQDDLAEDIDFSLTYSTNYDPSPETPKSAGRYFTSSTLEARADLREQYIYGVSYNLSFFSTLRIHDDLLERTYLDNMGLEFSSDFYGRVGFQGKLSYDGNYNADSDMLDKSQLTLDDVAITIKIWDELYVSSVFNELWYLNGTNPDGVNALNFQPEFRVIWDRCCWALYSSWDTASGEFTFTITTPGGNKGFSQGFPTKIKLPGRKTENESLGE
jgi:hypothetical protein